MIGQNFCFFHLKWPFIHMSKICTLSKVPVMYLLLHRHLPPAFCCTHSPPLPLNSYGIYNLYCITYLIIYWFYFLSRKLSKLRWWPHFIFPSICHGRGSTINKTILMGLYLTTTNYKLKKMTNTK